MQKKRRKKTGPQAGFLRSSLPYWLAPDAGAAIAAEADASEAGADIADDADVSGVDAGATTTAGAEAEVSAAGAAWSLLLLHAASAKAAIREATRRDFFMITSFYG